ncbi:uncharacterized protein KY384_008168 [Bacidia gigantensis]|uniref:uncharacterized protein n=1 Tax=Bacidia gigantensis TaxID=2732470 RepID=UPI001D050448|nr:uncharacterized protein KY384_008168 [Bacidia gigantensis]KAG8526739.1 hypothetical protein KY384_008168 [Bacidia gigantensis]
MALTIIIDGTTNAIDRFVAQKSKDFLKLGSKATKSYEKEQKVLQQVILSLSDQQLLVGLGMAIAGALLHCQIPIYNFSFVDNLAWASFSVHMTTLLAIGDYLKRHPSLKNWRALLMTVQFCFLIAFEFLQAHDDWGDYGCVPAQCAFDDNLMSNIHGSSALWLAVDLVLLSTGYVSGMSNIYNGPSKMLHKWFHDWPERVLKAKLKEKKDGGADALSVPTLLRPYMEKVFGAFHGIKYFFWKSLLTLYRCIWTIYGSSCILWAGSLGWFGYVLYQIVDLRTNSPSSMDGDQNKMGFGQIVPVCLLASTYFAYREAVAVRNGECRLA